MPPSPVRRRSRALLPLKSFAAHAAAMVAGLVILALSYRSMNAREEAAEAVNHTNEVQQRLHRFLSFAIDAETGQRGYLLTGEPRYLGPYHEARGALASELAALRVIIEDRKHLAHLDTIERLANDKLAELAETIELKRAGDEAKALATVRSDRGRATMDRIRSLIAETLDDEQRQLAIHTDEWKSLVQSSTYVVFGGSALLILMLLIIGFFASRDFRTVEAEAWVRRVQLALGSELQGDLRLASLGDKLLAVLVSHVDAVVGAVYVVEPDELRRVAGHALDAATTAESIRPGESLTGQAAKENRFTHVRELPEGYLPVRSTVGSAAPRELVIAPAAVDGKVQAVIELGFLHHIDAVELDALHRISEAVAVAVRSSRDRTKLEELLEETQRQAEELQSQQEELRVTNEELEQQSRALQLSQTSLENQQSELEEINAQLEEQSQSLERQRDDLARAGTELQRSNEYKSQFLANMSHELRTPLNSSLILAKLLSDNREGNLNEEQIKFARTIYSAGNDLLTLINDILDLSKIEAGMLDVRPEVVVLARLADELTNTFQPIATHKQLALEIGLADGAPVQMETDPVRLQQILKNLMSNALKFTERGGVSLRVSAHGDRVHFTVQDTGIGIAADQHALIFEAFRQADGASNRKFGGTGLGLSISRDLARLLGGDLKLDSTPGRGSVFTLILPLRLVVPVGSGGTMRRHVQTLQPPAVPSPAPRPPEPASRQAPAPLAGGAIADDRNQVNGTSRTLLVIEDDPAFARVLLDLVSADDVETVGVGTTAAALEHLKSTTFDCMVLDLSLPDRSGLELLEEMARGEQYGFPPVIVYTGRSLSADEVRELEKFSRSIIIKGARSPERLVDEVTLFLHQVESALPPERQRMLRDARDREAVFEGRRILIVEDDVRNVFALSAVLEPKGARVSIARNGREALEQLDKHPETDLVLMDIMMPEMDGLDATRALRRDPRFGKLPVIALTAKAMSDDRDKCIAAGANDYIAKPLDVDKLLSLARVWIRK